MENSKSLKEKSLEIRKATLNLYRASAGFRLASSLSVVEILVALYYGDILKFNPKDPRDENRDRFIISKGHGSISFYPILADLGFFDKAELDRMSQPGSFLADIPDTRIPGYETINGALGHGLGVACGVAIALKRKESDAKVFVLISDGELYEGAVWEAIMFAGHHKLGNLNLIVDNNKRAMMGDCKEILDLEPVEEKFKVFNWRVKRVDGHDVEAVKIALEEFKKEDQKPKVLIADTIKGKGVPQLELDPMSHIKNLKEEEVLSALQNLC
ncbi:MAG: transketolase [Candidatus Wolfebacteria bacterium]|nr:transketolase [Candidatus Wolfebacteria bacterium]